jgi:hypothetical protein
MLSYDRALWALRTWLDAWSGIGHVAVGMAAPGLRAPTRARQGHARSGRRLTGVDLGPSYCFGATSGAFRIRSARSTPSTDT